MFLAPPWGGIDYSCEENYSLLKSVRPNMRRILEKALEFSNKLILSLPRNSNIEELLGLLVDSGKFGERASVEIEKIYLNNRFKMIMVYFGNASKVI